MAAYTWRGGQGGAPDPDIATVAANWLDSTGAVATTVPGPGDTVVIPSGALPLDIPSNATIDNVVFYAGSNDTINFTTIGTYSGPDLITGGTIAMAAGGTLNAFDTTFNGMSMSFGTGSTINVSGDTQQTGTLFDNNSGTAYETVDGSAITGGGNLVQTGASLVFNASGNVDSDNSFVATVSGGNLTIEASALNTAAGTVPGTLMLTSGVISFGENVTLESSSEAAIGNNAEMIIAGGSLSLLANLLPVSGAYYLIGAATADIDTGVPGGQGFVFSGTNEILKIENAATLLADFGGSLAGFASGDTVELVGLSGLTGTYDNETLTLSQGSTVEGALSFTESEALDSNLGSDGFTVTSTGGNTFITTSATNDTLKAVTPGTTVDWGTAATWSNGVPVAGSVAEIALNTTEIDDFLSGIQPSYTLRVDTAETAGSVVFSDPLGTLDIAAPLTLLTPSSGGGGLTTDDGTVEIVSGGTLSASTYLGLVHANLQIAAGGKLLLSGESSDSVFQGWGAMDVENNASIDGIVTAAGFLQVGKASPQGGSVTLESGGSLTDSYSVFGGRQFGQANVQVTGAGTTWKDAGDAGSHPADTATELGDMVIGGGGINGSGHVPVSGSEENGSAQLNVDQGATVEESGSAILGMTGLGAGNPLNSSGNAFFQNDSTWDIANQLEVGGSHLYDASGDYGGSGIVQAISGAQILLGTTETAGLYKIDLGVSVGSFGSIYVGGQDTLGNVPTLNAGGGPIAIGEAGTGVLQINNGGDVTAAANATAGFAWAAVLGDLPGSSGTLNLSAAGSTPATSFTAGGNMVVGNAGQGTVQVNEGTLTVTGSMFLGGTPSGASSGSGTLSVLGGGVFVSGNLYVGDNSTLTVQNGVLQIGGGSGGGSGIVVNSGATLTIAGQLQLGNALDNAGTVLDTAIGQTLELSNGLQLSGTGVYAVGAGATLRMDGNPATGTFAFQAPTSGADATVILGNASGSDTLQNFYGNALIDLPFANYANESPSVRYTPNSNPATGGTAEIDFSNGGSIDFPVIGNHPAGFAVMPDSSGGTEFYANNSAAPCFAAGTRISTARGAVAVEALSVGDLVVLADGGTARIVWLGHRTLDCRRHPRPHDVLPVRVSAGAFGPGLPARDLLLSPDHAVFAHGVLIPVRYLLNGRTVAQQAAARVTYWHVELERHAVLLAEALPCESYLDTGNRAAFANGGAATQLHPDFALGVWAAQACALLVRDGERLAAVRRALLARAADLGHGITADPGLQLWADGRALAAKPRGARWRLALPPGTASVTLRSRIWVPAETRASETDTRRLGVAFARLWLDRRAVALDSAALSHGWHSPEPGWRWTEGAAALQVDGARELAFDLTLAGDYWREDIDNRHDPRTDCMAT